MKTTTLWKSYGMYSLKELEELEKDEREYLKEYHETEEPTDEEVTDSIYSNIDIQFEDEQSNLFRILDGRILCIASMGLWDGRRSGYKVLGNNLNEILTCSIGCDEKEVYYDRYNVYATGYHHDGSNSVEFREIREDRNIDNFLEKLYSNEPITRREINYYTRSLRPYIKEIFGN